MKLKKWIIPGLMLLSLSGVFGQEKEEGESQFFISTSAFVLFNIFTDPAPDFYQLNLGYHLTEKDVLIVEAITWRFDYPLGIPYGDHFDDPDYAYPGFIREFGVGLAYQHFYWKGFFSTIHVTPMYRRYVDQQGDLIDAGFQLFTSLRLGYHFNLLEDRFFIEPSMACTYWPINTNVPEDFAAMEKDWPNYFLFEPGLNLGINF